jgi:ribosomal protein S18 acetylase RimI-like enzyme
MWTTRSATTSDLPALRKLCQDSVGPDDYVLDFLERFILESATLVATDGDRIAGMMVYDDTPDGAVWLHAARTHPEHRRRGVAAALNLACEALARTRGRSCLRLWAEARNTASVAASLRFGFEERARFTRMRLPAPRSGLEVRLEPLDVERDWPFLESSTFLRRTGRYLFHDFYFLPMTRANARWLASEGALWRFGDHAVAISEDFEDVWGRDLQVQLLFGDAAEILRATPSIAVARKADRVESFLPHDPRLLEVAEQARFTFMGWGREAILFEKQLRR